MSKPSDRVHTSEIRHLIWTLVNPEENQGDWIHEQHQLMRRWLCREYEKTEEDLDNVFPSSMDAIYQLTLNGWLARLIPKEKE